VVDPLLGRGAARDLVTLARIGRTLTGLTRSDVVTVAAMDGLAVGMGTVLALACDLRLMADDARAGLPEAALGVLAASGGTQRLVHAVGTGRALELLLDGRWLTAREAVDVGLVHRAVPADRLAGEAGALAARLADRPAAAVREVKRLVHDAATRPVRRGLATEAASLVATLTSGAAEPRLAAYGRWLAEHPDATDDVVRLGWAPLLDGRPHAPDAPREP
jgi:enoyl-CoA hydratase